MAMPGNHANNSKKVLSDFEKAKIGILTGTIYDDYAKNLFPGAERKYFNLLSDMIFAVENGKIDGFLAENTYVSAALWEGARIDTVKETIDQTEAGYILRKESAEAAKVREQLNAFLTGAKANGLLDQLNTKWIGDTEPTELFDHNSLSGENGTLRVAVSPDLKPLCYMKNGAVAGYEVEVLQHFAKEYGYQLEFHSMAFDAILPGVVSGKYDIGCGGMTITEERAESVDFTESYLTVNVVMVISDIADLQSEPSFWDDIKESFEKTFIREERWKLIAEGIGVTMLISVCSVLAGSLLGFSLYMLGRSDYKILQKLTKGFAKGYSRIVAGTPIVVILMILFYVVFGQVRNMSGIVVAVIGFTLTFGAFVYDHMTVSVGSVDRGQTEAAYALGYTKNKTFFRIIFPQAMNIFLPSYCGQAVELIKATAVVGYIAVNDLTKMGDIIRSNTYEAFFPLIATAIIYFLLTWALSLLLGLIKLRFEPKRRCKETILKGVKTK
jgi:polar amino acid transport system substrate-binding protein